MHGSLRRETSQEYMSIFTRRRRWSYIWHVLITEENRLPLQTPLCGDKKDILESVIFFSINNNKNDEKKNSWKSVIAPYASENC